MVQLFHTVVYSTVYLKIDRFIGVLKGKLGQGSRVGYRKLPPKNTGDTLKGPDGTVLVTAPLGFLNRSPRYFIFRN
jgi:hypothetical protein